MDKAIVNIQKDALKIKVYPSRRDLGEAAAAELTELMKSLFAQQAFLNVVFAAAPSQQEFFEALCKRDDIEWHRVNAFHLDEYVNLPADAPQRFGNFLKIRLFDKCPFHSIHYLNGDGGIAEASERYTALLHAYPLDIVCLGIGENGHIAFNDPHTADFNDPDWVKIVSLDEVCRQQQVNDGCFKLLDDVPTHALTLTIPALKQARYFFCMVPGKTKANAVFHTCVDEISERLPATYLRLLDNATLYTDTDSAAVLLDTL